MNSDNHAVKAIICDIHANAVMLLNGPSKKFMRGFYPRHPSPKRTSAEYVDHGHINMANKDTITDYFKLY